MGDRNYTILLCKTVLTAPSETQIRGLGGHQGRAGPIGLIADMPTA